jgi:hypothetical protein
LLVGATSPGTLDPVDPSSKPPIPQLRKVLAEVPFINLFIETGGTAGIQFSYERA